MMPGQNSVLLLNTIKKKKTKKHKTSKALRVLKNPVTASQVQLCIKNNFLLVLDL